VGSKRRVVFAEKNSTSFVSDFGVCEIMSQNVDDLHQKDEDVSPHLAL